MLVRISRINIETYMFLGLEYDNVNVFKRFACELVLILDLNVESAFRIYFVGVYRNDWCNFPDYYQV